MLKMQFTMVELSLIGSHQCCVLHLLFKLQTCQPAPRFHPRRHQCTRQLSLTHVRQVLLKVELQTASPMMTSLTRTAVIMKTSMMLRKGRGKAFQYISSQFQ